jgi:hypothetical protein
MAEQQVKNLDVYALILNAKDKMPRIAADPRAFARKVQNELESITAALASDQNIVVIDGKKIDKTSASGQLVINDKLSQIEALNNQNFNLISVIRKTEDSLRQII